MDADIAVVGATGFTGRLVASALARRGASVRLVGRDRTRLATVLGGEESGTAVVDSWDRYSLAHAIRGCGAVAACAGPFTEVGYPVVVAAVDARVPYCDSTGEQAFIRRVFDELDGRADRASIPLVPAFGFDFVPGDVGATLAAEGMGPLHRVEVVYVVEDSASSVGTRRSVIAALAAPCYQLVDGRLSSERVGARRRAVTTSLGRRIAASVPGGDVITIPRHLDVATVHTYMNLPGTVRLASPVVPILSLALRLPGMARLLSAGAARGPAGPTEEERHARVACHVEVVARDGTQRALLIEGNDPYGFTADALSRLAATMAEGGLTAVGACAPSQVIDPKTFLTEVGFTVKEAPLGAGGADY